MGPLDTLAPPTDNLYKFIAIFGLVLIVLGVGTSLYQDEELEKYALANKVANAKYMAALFSVQDVEAKLKVAQDAEKPELDKERAEAHNRYDDAHNDALAAQAGIESAENEAQSQSPKLDTLSVAGFWISAIGFLAWYLKVQRYEDLVLRSEALKHNAEWNRLYFWEQLFGERTGWWIIGGIAVILVINYFYPFLPFFHLKPESVSKAPVPAAVHH